MKAIGIAAILLAFFLGAAVIAAVILIGVWISDKGFEETARDYMAARDSLREWRRSKTERKKDEA